MPRRRILFAVIISVALLAAAAPKASAAPGCGSSLTTSFTLQNDIGPCAAGGFTIDADNVTVDLNGYKIYGTSSTGDGSGIFSSGHAGLVVKNGSISGFDEGISIIGGDHNKVSRVKVLNNVGSSGSGTGDGIFVNAADFTTIDHVTARSNGPFSGITITLLGIGSPDGNRISNSVISGNAFGVIVASGDRTTVSDNTIEGNVGTGIDVTESPTNTVVSGNRVNGNGFGSTPRDGIMLIGPTAGPTGNKLVGNKVADNARYGINVQSGSVGNTLKKNVAKDNAIADPSAYDLFDGNTGCVGNVWRDNKGRRIQNSCTTR